MNVVIMENVIEKQANVNVSLNMLVIHTEKMEK